MIAAGRFETGLRHQRRAAVDRFAVRGVEIVRLVVVVGRHRHARVVRRAAENVAVCVDHPPVLAAVIGSPELSAIRFLTFPRNAVASFDCRVDAIRIRMRGGRHHFADRLRRQPVPLELLPRRAAVARHEQPAAGSAALAPPGMDLDLPHPGEEDPRIARMRRDLRTAAVFVDEERPLPGGAAVSCPEDAALGLRPVRRAQRACENDLRIGRIDDDAADAAGLVQTHARPRLAGVHRLVDAVADRDMAANPRLARSGPDDVRIGRRNGERADRLRRLLVEDLLPVDAAVDGLRDAARRAACIVHERIARNADDGGDAIAFRSDEPPAELTVDVRCDPRRLSLREKSRAHGHGRNQNEQQFFHFIILR